jgi:hypothetical protein
LRRRKFEKELSEVLVVPKAIHVVGGGMNGIVDGDCYVNADSGEILSQEPVGEMGAAKPDSASYNYSLFANILLFSDSVVGETDFLHHFAVEEISTIEHNWGMHGIADLIEIHMLKFRPLGSQNQCISPKSGGEG